MRTPARRARPAAPGCPEPGPGRPDLPLAVLVTNIALVSRSGTEVVAEQLADGLRRRGHRVALFSPHLGPLAARLRERGHLVLDRPGALPWRPEVIHGHHAGPTMAALAAHPGVPGIFVSHSATAPFDAAPRHPRLARVFAVDEFCRARLVADGLPPEAVGLLPNAVDLSRIPPRSRPLPDRPRRAVALLKQAGPLDALREACGAAGIELSCFGAATGRIADHPEAAFAEADLVFATARSALEAAAAGAGVVVCDARGLAGFLTAARAEAWLPCNLGAGVLAHPTTPGTVAAAIAAWSAPEAEAAAALVRAERPLERALDRLEDAYRAAMAAPPALAADEARATGDFLAGWVPGFDPAAPGRRLARDCAEARPDPTVALAAELERLRAAFGTQQATLTQLCAALDHQRGWLDGLRSLVEGMEGRAAAERAAEHATLLGRMAELRGEVAALPAAVRGPGLGRRGLAALGMAWRRLVPLAVRARLRRTARG